MIHTVQLNSLLSTPTFKQNIHFYHDKSERTATSNVKIKAGIGSVLSTSLGVIALAQKHNIRNPLKIRYGLPEMCAVSFCAILGGLSAGMFGNDKKTKKHKLKEGLFQFSNAIIPTWIAGAALKLCETSKKTNNIPVKIFSTLTALVVGMHGAADLANKVIDPKGKEPDRKLKMTDCLANFDDFIGLLVLAKIPFLKKLPIEEALPLIFAYCGYKAGKSN